MKSKKEIIRILHREEVLFAQEICVNEDKRALSDFADNPLFVHFDEYLSIPKQYVVVPYIHENCLQGYEVTTLKGGHGLDDPYLGKIFTIEGLVDEFYKEPLDTATCQKKSVFDKLDEISEEYDKLMKRFDNLVETELTDVLKAWFKEYNDNGEKFERIENVYTKPLKGCVIREPFVHFYYTNSNNEKVDGYLSLNTLKGFEMTHEVKCDNV